MCTCICVVCDADNNNRTYEIGVVQLILIVAAAFITTVRI